MSNNDNRSWITHKVHQWGHEYNASRKESGKSGIETSGIYRSVSPKGAKDKDWSIEVDNKRAEYHRQKQMISV